MNPYAVALLGYSVEQWYSEEDFLARCLHPDDRDRVLNLWRSTARDGVDRWTEHRMIDAQGRILHVRTDVHGIPNEGGAVQSLVGVMADLTHAPRYRLDDEEQRQASNILAAVIESTSDLVFVKDLQGRYVLVNTAFARLVGRSIADIVGKTTEELFPAEVAERLVSHDREAMTEGRAPAVEEVFEKDGVRRTYLTTRGLLRDEHGTVWGLFGISRDITERKRSEDELRILYERLQEFDRLKTRFFANVSHELRTPLTLVIGLADRLLQDSALDEAQRRDVEAIAQNARGLLKHVNDLLDVAKLEAGRLRPDYAEVDLARLVRLTTAPFEVLASERKIAYTVETPERVPAQLDPEKIQRVLTNLLSNAFKYTPPGGKIRCTLQVVSASEGGAWPGGRAVITVADSGPGVPPEFRQAVFERFYQIEGGPARPPGGTGLGLAIAKEFTELHGGTIGVGDAPEGGAQFTVELPLMAPPGQVVRGTVTGQILQNQTARLALDALRTHLRQTVATTEVTAEGKALVLVVEDHPEMNRFLAETLGRQYRVATAFDGRQGLEMALSLHPDLILTDVMMPKMTGDELVHEIRRHPELAATPIVLLTAKADDELRVKLLREGAQDYVTKPFSVEELRARVDNLIVMKRVRELLQRELASQLEDLEALAQEMTRRKRELQTALDAIQVAREQAERASQTKSMFLSMVSHELRTPLTILKLHLQLLLQRARAVRDASEMASLQKMSVAADRLVGLIDSLLEYVQIESGRLTVHPERFDLAELAQEVVEELRPQAEEKNLQLSLVQTSPMPLLDSDRRLVRLAIVNLVSNAIKFTERGMVEVTVGYDQGLHRISVRDTGPGIPRDQQAAIFEPFYQLEPVQLKHVPGLGLGLALVREMLQALRGRIELQSEVGVGSTFTIVLPPYSPVQVLRTVPSTDTKPSSQSSKSMTEDASTGSSREGV